MQSTLLIIATYECLLNPALKPNPNTTLANIYKRALGQNNKTKLLVFFFQWNLQISDNVFIKLKFHRLMCLLILHLLSTHYI